MEATPLKTRKVEDCVRAEVRTARKRRRCDLCRAWIEVGSRYRHLTALPGHEFAQPWETLAECPACAARYGRPVN